MKDFGIMIRYPPYVWFEGEILDRPMGFPRMGNMQLTYFLEDKVLQVGPAVSESIPEKLCPALTNWILPRHQYRKGELLYQFHSLLKNIRQSGFPFQWYVPSILDYGSYRADDLSFPYWVQERVSGIAFNSYLDRTDAENGVFSVLYGLISFLGSLHSLSFPHALFGIYAELSDCSLRTHYKKRLSCYQDVLEKIKKHYPEFSGVFRQLRSFINRKSEIIDDLITQDETVVYVHNDFRGDNIIIEAGILNIIDLEQGLYGGDWLCDLYKIGLLPVVPIMHRELLSESEKRRLIEVYLLLRQHTGERIFTGFLEENRQRLIQRIDLLKLDFMVSALILRHIMGWNFHIHALERQEFRGAKFILHLINQELLRTIRGQA